MGQVFNLPAQDEILGHLVYVTEILKWSTKVVAGALIRDGYYRVSSPTGGLSLTATREPIAERRVWVLKLGAFPVVWAADQMSLEGPQTAVAALVNRLQDEQFFLPLVASRQAAAQALEEFRASLRPDARLRKLLLNGHCDECP